MTTSTRMVCLLAFVAPWLPAGCGDSRVGPPAFLEEERVTSLAITGADLCVLRGDGTGACIFYGSSSSIDTKEVSSLGDAEFLKGAISLVPRSRACALFKDRTVRCAGGDDSLAGVKASDVAQAIFDKGSLCTVKTDGSAPCWGAAPDGTVVKQIGMTWEAQCVLLTDGTVYCKDSLSYVPEGAKIEGIDGATLLSVGSASGNIGASTHSYGCAVIGGGRVKCWGANFDGQLGDGTTRTSATAVSVIDTDADNEPISEVIALDVNYDHSCAITSDGAVHCWGVSAFHDGLGAARIPDIDDAKALAVGSSHDCALRTDDTVVCWKVFKPQEQELSCYNGSVGAGR